MHRVAPLVLALLLVPAALAGRGAPRVDRTAPVLGNLAVDNGGGPFRGDGPLVTTISPNGDGVRDRAQISFHLSESATVTLEVDRTTKVPVKVFTETVALPAGDQLLTWAPPASTPPRTYVVRLTVEDAAGNRRTYGSGDAWVSHYPAGPVVRVLGVDAGFTASSYAPGQLAWLRIATDAPSLQLVTFRAGPEQVPTYADDVLNGVPVSSAVTLDWGRWQNTGQLIRFRVGDWPSGLYYAQLTAPDGRVGYAPFVVRPAQLGQNRVAVVLPTNTWQAYNFQDTNLDGWGDTWYAGPPHVSVGLGRPFIHRGVPPFFRRYDLGFLHWLRNWGKQVDYLSDDDLAAVDNGATLARLYDLVVFPGHTEYETQHTFDLVREYRDQGGNLMFLSANNFFWRVEDRNGRLRKITQFRQAGRPEAGMIGVQYRANDEGRKQGLYVVRNAEVAPWVWAGTGLGDGAAFGAYGGYGIEIDSTTPDSPPGTQVLAEIPDLFGPGVTAQMTYYETPAGAKVFAAGSLDFGGSADQWPITQILENVWERLSAP